MPFCRRSSFITLRDKEIGCKCFPGDTAKIQSSLSSCIKAHHTWDPRNSVSDSDHGGVFNFDFSKNGSLLGAACERKSVLLFDPFNGKLVARKNNAHSDCVNCVKFLDDRLFATCSDDTTVALWDTRYLKHTVQTFRGHSNWVKNIEYDAQQGILVTSGFDGCIYAWNINRYSDEEPSNKVFYTSGLMRSKLSPDFSKLIISTHEGYIIVVHNLDLAKLGDDLKGFKPSMYRLMQRSRQPLNLGLMYNHVFEQERNRVQFIADWPTGNDASVISSLQVHPQGWCILSRNTDSSEATEWTCVHELQDDTSSKKSTSKRLWEMDMVTPHTSSAYCQSTNTPAYSSLAPSNQSRAQSTRSTNQDSTSLVADQSDEETSDSRTNREVDEHPTGSSQSSNSTRQVSEPMASALVNDASLARPERQVDISRYSTGRIHNSLIQIRRGAVQEDGSYSLSISVHTSSGRTIEFNQEDLASDDDESDIRIERIIRNPLPDHSVPNTSDNATGEDPGVSVEISTSNNSLSASTSQEEEPDNAPAGNRSNVNNDEILNNSSDENNEILNNGSDDDNDEPLINGSDDNYDNVDNESIEYDDFLEEIEHESDLDLIEEYNDGDVDLNDDADDDDEVIREPSGIEVINEPEVEPEPIDLDADARTLSRSREDLFRYSGWSRIRRRNSESSSNIRQNSASAQNSASSSSTQSVNIQRSDNSSSSNTGSRTIDSLPANNSLTFVLESNTGHRRRQILNLSYLNRYTEAENQALLKKVHWNRKALLGYAEECNVGQGFIKEVGFSSDGRLISSPFGYGLRIFAFDSHCNELCDCIPASPVKLYEVTCSMAHSNCVVATKFSPVHNLVVTGCLDGKIAFHQPVL
ncbi:DDB1- and CUL4-associated factor 10 [Mactra antiquata]